MVEMLGEQRTQRKDGTGSRSDLQQRWIRESKGLFDMAQVVQPSWSAIPPSIRYAEQLRRWNRRTTSLPRSVAKARKHVEEYHEKASRARQADGDGNYQISDTEESHSKVGPADFCIMNSDRTCYTFCTLSRPKFTLSNASFYRIGRFSEADQSIDNVLLVSRQS